MNTELSRGRRNLILINACVITFMATLDGSIVNIALPTMAEAFSVGISAVQWVVTSYLITVSALLLVWGGLSDIHGRKPFFAVGLGVFTLGSLLCGISTNLSFLVASRVLQALGASMAIALVQGIVTAAFPPNERGKALGFIGAVVSIGSLLGPSLGGVLVETAGWRSIFFINVPIGVIGIILTLIVMPNSKSEGGKLSFDSLGAFLLSAAIVLFFGGMLSLQDGILPPAAAGGAVLGGLLLFAAFIALERRREAPLIDGSLFKNRVFTMGVIDSCLSFIAMFSYTFFAPFYLQSIRGMTVLKAGAIMSIYPAITAILAPLAGSLSDRITYRPLTISGLICTTIGLLVMSTFGSQTPLAAIGADIFLLGLGGAMFQSPNNSSIMGTVPRDRLGIAGSLNAFFRNLGMVIGTSLSVSLFVFATKAQIDSVSSGSIESAVFLKGFRVVILTAAGFALAGAIGEVFGKNRAVNEAGTSGERG